MQKELDLFRDTVWNSHRIRKQRDARLPKGIPDHIFNFPENYDAEQCGKCLSSIYRYYRDLSGSIILEITFMWNWWLTP